MKRFAMTGGALLVMAAFSCTRELDVVPVSQECVFEAVWADDPTTRTALQQDGTSIWWTVGEEINVFYGTLASAKFVSTNTQVARLAYFSGSLPGAETGSELYWCVYPFDAANACDGESVTLTIPAEQYAVEDSFADKSFPAVAVSQDFCLDFYNVCGGARFSVANEGIYAVTFEALGGEKLVGKVKVAFGDDGKTVIRQVTGGSSEVTVEAPAGGFVPGKDYFAAFLPGTLSQGLRITYRTRTQSASITRDNSLTINRSRFGIIDRKDAGLTFVDGGAAEDVYYVPGAVDLGLPSGLKWASCNLGASRPEEFGDYFAWGVTSPYYSNLNPLTWKVGKSWGYVWDTYKWCVDGYYWKLTKYCTSSSLGYNGFTDGKTVLDPVDDAAHVHLGGNWRMPTYADCQELLDYCREERTSINDVAVLKVIGPNGNSIYLPYASNFNGVYFMDENRGWYWTSTRSHYSECAYNLYFDSSSYPSVGGSNYRCNGFSIRPVTN